MNFIFSIFIFIKKRKCFDEIFERLCNVIEAMEALYVWKRIIVKVFGKLGAERKINLDKKD